MRVCALDAPAKHSHGSSSSSREALQTELQQLDVEKRRIEDLLVLRRSQFQLLMHAILDFQRTAEETVL